VTLLDPAGTASGAVVRRRVRVRGVVQGVGYRPFVYRLAASHGLAGFVGNDSAGVFVEVEGGAVAIAGFVRGLREEAPPLARVDAVEDHEVTPLGDAHFTIVASEGSRDAHTFVPADAATCVDCRRELFDPRDRRYRYPFVNCTNCGPRFTIATALPYDRANTTMSGFALCPACRSEYGDPADRRYHAEPVACPVCGPQIAFEGPGERIEGTDAVIAAAQDALARGAVLALKGIGGYHLACAATSREAVRRLRARKHRPDKPFAVMVRDVATASRYGRFDEPALALLTSPAAPIVLVRARDGTGLAPEVAPDTPLLGLFLPYSPLHHLLFAPVPGCVAAVPDALVMTSGNLGDEPICFDDAEARERLSGIADAWIEHDRGIHVPCDDSVVRVADGHALPVRRSRGYAPLPVPMPLPIDTDPVLAVGGELKNAFCVATGREAWMSQHIGDMGSVATLHAFDRSTARFRDFYGVEPARVVADLHPAYLSRRWAEETGLDLVGVQHHHAHVAALMAEHGVGPHAPVLGFAFDGTGYGTDGTIWGGEVLLATYARFRRVAHLRTVELPGGDHGVRRPALVALAHLRAAGLGWDADLAPVRAVAPDERAALRRRLDRSAGVVATSSVGRLFDAVSSLLGLRHETTYEGQAAIALETVGGRGAGGVELDPFGLDGDEIDPAPVLRHLVAEVRRGTPVAALAVAFHRVLADAIVSTAERVRADTGVATVGLTGGVFQNALLTRQTRRGLEACGFDVLVHRVVPPNDGGLALGQVAVAAASGVAEPAQ
jgi:hydrogenase maturation protein HypF